MDKWEDRLNTTNEPFIPPENVFEQSAFSERREEVRRLREIGHECDDIAKQTGIPYEEVVQYCVELGFPILGNVWGVELPPAMMEWMKNGKKGSPGGKTCRVCGAPIVQQQGGRQVYCSEECRKKWWQQHWKEAKQRHGRKAVCAYCGKEFCAINEAGSKRKYCSRDCYFNDRYGEVVNSDEQ